METQRSMAAMKASVRAMKAAVSPGPKAKPWGSCGRAILVTAKPLPGGAEWRQTYARALRIAALVVERSGDLLGATYTKEGSGSSYWVAFEACDDTDLSAVERVLEQAAKEVG